MIAFNFFVNKINKITLESATEFGSNHIWMNLSVRGQLGSTEISQMCIYNGSTLSEASQSQLAT